MKIGILSDSHDNMAALAKAVSIFNDAGVSLVIHAGDLVAPFVSKPLSHLTMDFIAVFGNNDGERQGLAQVFKEKIFRPPHLLHYYKKKILIMHEPDQLDALAYSGRYDAIIYGHTHEIDIRHDPALIINPGECGGWVSGRRTAAIWDMDKGYVNTVVV